MDTTKLNKRFPGHNNAITDATGDKERLSIQLKDLRSQRSIISWEIRKVKAELAEKSNTRSSRKATKKVLR